MSGVVFDQLNDILKVIPQYTDWRAGRASREYFSRWVAMQDPTQFGLNLDQLSLSTRMPLNDEEYVDDCLERLKSEGLIASIDYPKSAYSYFERRVDSLVMHANYSTYIFPEERRLLFALAHVLEMKRWAFLGSYYGYWAIWAAAALETVGGSALLVDVDNAAQHLARINAQCLGLSGTMSFLVADATLPLGKGEFDVLVLDAEGPKDHPDARRRDKAIYAPILEASLPDLRPGGIVISHNMLLSNPTDLAYFDEKVRHNEKQYTEFHQILSASFDAQVLLPTTEGIGVYRRRPGSN